MVYREDDQEIELREKTRKAISLAMESRWQEAAAVNRELLDQSPNDLESCNRLGKALMEMGDTDGARHAFAHSLEISASNTIARKNLERLASMPSMPSAPKPNGAGGSRIAPRLFISDSGKTAQVTLFAPAPEKQRPYLSTGATLALHQQHGGLAVSTEAGEYLGMVPPKMGRRLACLMDGGNRYEAAMFTASGDSVKVVLRETYQHPLQRSKLSFPSAEPSPEPVLQAEPIADDADTEFEAPSIEPPLDLSWMEDDVADDDDEEPLGVASAARNAMDASLIDDSLFSEAEEE